MLCVASSNTQSDTNRYSPPHARTLGNYAAAYAGRVTAAISPISLQAGNAAESTWIQLRCIARKQHAAAVPLAASSLTLPSRCCLPMALKAAHAAHDRAVWDAQSHLQYPKPLKGTPMPPAHSVEFHGYPPSLLSAMPSPQRQREGAPVPTRRPSSA